MKKVQLLCLLLLVLAAAAKAQNTNPFKSIGKKGKIITLSRGRYEEVFDTDTIQRIGSVLYNTRTKKVVKLLDEKQVYEKYSDNTSSSRWYSVDPLADKFAQYSPYNFCVNNPINLIDPTGMAATDWVGKINTTGGTNWSWDENVKSEEQAKAAGYDSYLAPGSRIENASINGAAPGVVFMGYSANDFGYDESNFTNWNAQHGSEYGNRTEAYRAWHSDPNYHYGEGFWDKTFRTIGYGTMEARREYAAGGMNMYGGYGRQLFSVNPSKFDYFFGKVVTGDAKNIARSVQNLNDLTQLGITTQEELIAVFNQAIKSGTIVSTKATEYGTTIMKSVNIGDKGSVGVGFFYEGGNMNLIPKITTLIPKIY